MTVQALLEEARKLSPEEQVQLLDELSCIVEPENEADVYLTPAQRQDLRARIEELDSGKAKLLPGDEVVQQLRRRK
jgi:putative addiction module component (TIGR02574 family)